MSEQEMNEESLRCGFATIVGRPNVGKSTLVNRILGEKVAIVSNVPQTTRNPIRGVYNDERGQIVFIDTPGLHLHRDSLGKFMNQSCIGTLTDVELIIHLVDSSERIGEEEYNVVQNLKHVKAPIVLGLNKIDLGGKYVHEYIGLWEEVRGCPVTEFKNFTLLPLSGKDGTHIEKLLDMTFEQLPVSPAFYERDTITDLPRKMAISDFIREKLFYAMKEEIPHSVAVIVEEMRPRKGKVMFIRALILVERKSQKEIVIGKKGETLKKIGSAARTDLEELLDQRVFLELYVKTKKNWRDNPAVLEDMGYYL